MLSGLLLPEALLGRGEEAGLLSPPPGRRDRKLPNPLLRGLLLPDALLELLRDGVAGLSPPPRRERSPPRPCETPGMFPKRPFLSSLSLLEPLLGDGVEVRGELEATDPLSEPDEGRLPYIELPEPDVGERLPL